MVGFAVFLTLAIAACNDQTTFPITTISSDFTTQVVTNTTPTTYVSSTSIPASSMMTTYPTTQSPTTIAPTTEVLTTHPMTSNEPTTVIPTTLAPTTVAPTTLSPTTSMPTTWALFSVSFNAVGGTPTSGYHDLTHGSLINAPIPPTLDGFVFAGWYREAAYLNEWDFSVDTVQGNLILYAYWIEDVPEPEGTAVRTAAEFHELVTTGQIGSDTGPVFYLANDLDFTGFSWGYVNHNFTRTFNGNGKTISNLTINGTDRTGIFSRVNGATITDLILDNVQISSTNRAGILIGEVDGTNVTVQNIIIRNSSVSGNSSNGVGGLIGYTKPNFTVDIANISIDASTITNQSSAAGGLIGMTDAGNVTIHNIQLTQLTITASERAAGVYGELKNSVQIRVSNMIIDADIMGGQYVGGLVGRNQSTNVSFSDVLIQGSLQSTANKNLGHLSGDQDIPNIDNVYLLDVDIIGTVTKQTVSEEYFLSSLDTVIDQTWWNNHLDAIAQNEYWIYDGSTYVLSIEGMHMPDSHVITLKVGHGFPDIIRYVRDGFLLVELSLDDITGYRFSGWSLVQSEYLPYDFEAVVTEALTLFAHWEVIPTYTVSVDGIIQTVSEGGNAIPPRDPVLQGKVFIGWFVEDVLFDFDTPITRNLIVEPRFRDASSFVLSFVPNNGDTIEPLSFYENQRITDLPKPFLADHRFYGWYEDAGLTLPFARNYLTDDLTIYARFVDASVVILTEDFDYAIGSSLGDSLWNETKPGLATIIDASGIKTLKLVEGGSEAAYDLPLSGFAPGRYVMVYDFYQGSGGASFTIELHASGNRVFTVGANRQNRVTYRNADGTETAVDLGTYAIQPSKIYRVAIIFDTENHFYKYYIYDGEDWTQITRVGGIDFMRTDPIDSIRIRIVGTTSLSSVPESYIQNLIIESSSEVSSGKSIYDPEPAIDPDLMLNQIYHNLTIPFADDIRGDLYLSHKMYLIPITWQSGNPTYISDLGAVTRPVNNPVSVTMTATFSMAGVTRTKSFNVTIKPIGDVPTFLEMDYSLNGFASGHVSIPDLKEGDPGYYVVTNPLEFMDAINAENSSSKGTTAARIIEIRADLDLGYLEVTQQYGAIRNFLAHSTPLMHPTLIQTGVSKIYIQDRDGSTAKYHEGLMIFSETGHTIRHASFNIKRANNIIIRNLRFDELWEWDEKDKGDYDTNDWDYFTVDTVNGIWFDHIELGKAYDGLIDFKAGSSVAASVVNATFSYMYLDFVVNDFIEAQFLHLEANRSQYKYYNDMRLAGMSMAEIMHLNSFQKKGFLLGGSELRAGNVFTLTIYNSYIRNLQDRFPRVRGGDVHIFNSIYDATDVYETRNLVRELYPTLFAKSEYNRQLTNQALVTTEQGAIFMEYSMILGVSQVIKSNQVNGGHPLMTGKYLVEDSLYVLGDTVFYGSSEDEDTAFIRANSEPILPFSWSTVTELPYSGYQLIPVNVLEDFFNMVIIGVTDQPFNWLTTESE
jgi:pectate lyase